MMEYVNDTPHILLAEDDEEMRKTLSSVLRARGFEVVECSDGLDLLKTFASQLHQTHAPGYSLLISDIRMPGLSGLEIIEGFRGKQGFPPVILITAFGDDETHAKARESGAVAVLDKPFEVEDLLAMVARTVGLPARTRRARVTDACDHPESPLMHGKAAPPG
jgi:DNA-binding response OmpR family regulator